MLISLMQSVNGVQILNTVPLFISSACLPAASAPVPAIVMVHLTNIRASI